MSKPSAIAVLLAALLLAGCLSTGGGPSSVPPKPHLLVVPGEIPCPPEKAAHIRTVLNRVGELRDAPCPDEITIMTADKAGLEKFMVGAMEEEWTTHDDHVVTALRMFGLIPQDMDLRRWMVDLMLENVAGFFNPKSNKVYSMKDSSADDTVWAHELTHLLDHQRFDLEAMQKRCEKDSDRSLALDALVEGSATGVMADFAIDGKASTAGKDDTVGSIFTRAVARKGIEVALKLATSRMKGRFAQSPLIVQRLMLFPYQAGLVFRNRLHAHGGNATIDAAFKQPPESTEQVLHPERYHLLGKPDRPHTIVLPKPPKGWSLLVEDGMGMLVLQVLMEHVSGKWSIYLAEGWDGDRFALWSTPQGKVIGWVMVWDYEAQAARFASWAETKFLKTVKGGAVARRKHVVAIVFGASANPKRAQWLLDAAQVKVRKGDNRPPRPLSLPEAK